MRTQRGFGLIATASMMLAARLPAGDDARLLRLVPFPKEVACTPGRFDLAQPLVLVAPAAEAATLAAILSGECAIAAIEAPATRTGGDDALTWSLAAEGAPPPRLPALRDGGGAEQYTLAVAPGAVRCSAAGKAGLFYGMQTFCQLIRANRSGATVPCVTIRDWPSLAWRCFQNDMTRGPSAHLATLTRMAALGAALKMNLFTYYMEYQFAFRSHPVIGPPDGSLTAEELQALVAFARPLHMEILGNQQSFGHFGRILAHPQYAHLRETPSLLCPVKEETYGLLDDLYGEVLPLLPFAFFNVCCDETWGLGDGPSKARAAQIGVGGVYIEHILRVRELITGKYGKRMMMWGDIILEHPAHLPKIPRDVLLLTWGYDARASFEDQITPFVRAGFEFMVCPGVSNWSRILPDFEVAAANIHAFVRDGAAHGARGMLNTEWKDDGESLNAPNWHGYAWGAECAWNASATALEDFNRRVGAVLFGEPGARFGETISLLGRAHRLPAMRGMHNARFWEDDFTPARTPASIRAASDSLLAVVAPAITHLEALREDAAVNADLVDGVLLGARRMELIALRMRAGLDAAERYADLEAQPAADAAHAALAQIEDIVRRTRDAHRTLGGRFRDLWLAESKPYALDWTLARYDTAVARYDRLLVKLAAARAAVAQGKPLPAAADMGLSLPVRAARKTRPDAAHRDPYQPQSSWLCDGAAHRCALRIEAGAAARTELPVEIDVPLPAEAVAGGVRAWCLIDTHAAQAPVPMPVQLAPGANGAARVTCIVPETIPEGGAAIIWLYFGEPATAAPDPRAVSTRPAGDGMHWIENDRLRLLLGPEGAHIWRWEVKAADNRDLTMPGTNGWAGFCDMAHGYRGATHRITCTARGPSLVRFECVEPASGLVKTISLFAGVSWVEVMLSEPAGHYWDFDDPAGFAGDGPHPGVYLFSNGATGPVGDNAVGVPAQVKQAGVTWGVKYREDGLALGLATPGIPAFHHIGPGAAAGGVGIERSPPANHFATFGGVLGTVGPRETMERLSRTLDLRRPVRVTLFALQSH